MKASAWGLVLLSSCMGYAAATLVQAPAVAGAARPMNDEDRLYTGDQSSNTITVIKPTTGEVLGTIALGNERLNDVLGPQYIKSVNAHGLGFSRDGKYIVSLSITSNTVTVIRCEDNQVMTQVSVDRSSHEAFFAADNRTIWVGTRGVDHIDIVDGFTGEIVGKVDSWGGPSKILFSPDGKTAYANHIRSASLSVIDVESRKMIHNITGLADDFSSDMMLSADGERLWVAHKMKGTISIISTKSRKVVGVLDTGVETNHPQFAVVQGVTHGFVTVAASNETKMFRQEDPEKTPTFVTSIKNSGVEPHGLWSSPDNTRLFVVNEHSDTVDFIDLTLSPPKVIKTVHVGQEGQSIVYVAGAVPKGTGLQNLGRAGLYRKPVQNKLIQIDENENDGHRGHGWRPRWDRGGSNDHEDGHGNGNEHDHGKGKDAPGEDSEKKATALVTIRPQEGLDMFQVIGRNLKLNTTYTASASCKGCHEVQIPLVDFSAETPTGDGCGTAPQVLAFFKWNDVYDLDTPDLAGSLGRQYGYIRFTVIGLPSPISSSICT